MNPRNQQDSSRGGFTIIEVVLVLAIAGLIFLMVFIALPALQRSQRDTQRRDDLARISQALTQYGTNNNGKMPWQINNMTGTKFIEQYITKGGDEFNDPNGGPYTISWSSGTGSPTNNLSNGEYEVKIYYDAKCDGEGVTNNKGLRNYAITYNLEGSGIYCEDNT